MDEAKAVTGRRSGELLGGRYRLGSVLGEGGFGLVYEGLDEQTGEGVAVKLLHAHLVDVQEVVKRFRREAALITSLRHPNIVEVRDSGTTDDGAMFLVMERLRGRELSTRLIAEGPLSIGDTVRIVQSACDALFAVHQAGIVHRDLKPDNVFLSDESEGRASVKLLDFGVSKVTGTNTGEVSLATQTGATLGTPYYMSPEQAQGKKTVDHRADIYALGVIIFRMLTGQHPFEDASYPMLVLKICTEPPPRITLYRADVPPELDAIVARMLAKDPAARFPDCATVRASLAPFAGLDAPPVMLDGPRTSETSVRALDGRMDSPLAHAATMSPVDLARMQGDAEDFEDAPPPKRRAVLPFVIVFGLIATAFAAWFFTRTPEPPPAQGVALPRALPATHSLLRTARGATEGWRWLNPLPRAMPTWNDVDVGGPNLVAMVGRGGRAAYYIGDGLFPVPSGTTATLHAVVWYGPTQTLAAGDEGTLRLITREGPQTIETHTRAALHGIATRSPTEAVVVGENGTMLRVVGSTVTSIDTGTDDDLLAVHVRGSDVFVAGESGRVLRWDGRALDWEQTGVRATLRAIGGCPEGDLYAAGDDGLVLRRRADGGFARLPSTGREPWSDIACVDGLVVLSGMRGGVLMVSGSRAVRLESDDARPLFGIGAAENANAWAVGAGGKLVALARDHLVVLTAGTTKSLYGLASFAGVPVAVGIDGQVLRLTDGRFQDVTPHATDAGLAAVVALSEAQLVAVGDSGVILTIDLDGARRVSSPTEASLRGVVASDEALVAIGAGGTVVRGTLGALVARTLSGVGTLYGIAGTPASAFIVGEGGAIFRSDAATEQRIACSEHADLRGVVLDGAGAVAVGDGGVIVRITDAGCVVERPFSATVRDLYAVAPGPNGRLLAVGESGTALERTDAGTWEPYELDAGGYDLHRIVTTDRDIFVIGAGGVVLRHPRIVTGPRP